MLTISVTIIAVLLLLAFSIFLFYMARDYEKFDNVYIDNELNCAYCGVSFSRDEVLNLEVEFQCKSCDRKLLLDVVKTMIIRRGL